VCARVCKCVCVCRSCSKLVQNIICLESARDENTNRRNQMNMQCSDRTSGIIKKTETVVPSGTPSCHTACIVHTKRTLSSTISTLIRSRSEAKHAPSQSWLIIHTNINSDQEPVWGQAYTLSISINYPYHYLVWSGAGLMPIVHHLIPDWLSIPIPTLIRSRFQAKPTALSILIN